MAIRARRSDLTVAAGTPLSRYAGPCNVTNPVTRNRRDDPMPTCGPWYSTRPGATKHHDNTRCIEGNNIEDRHVARGKGQLPLCRRCAELNAAGK
jgi:hypothetical protein